MQINNVADSMVQTMIDAGVKRIYGIVGDSLNGITEAARHSKVIDWVHVRHEEVAAFAAGAEAQVTDQLAVCAGSCGPGNLHLINGLYDCHRSRVPVLAIAAQIPSSELGSGYFQETNPQKLFADCSHYCEVITSPEQMPRVMEMAIRNAVNKRGVSVVIISGDVALTKFDQHYASLPGSLRATSPVIRPSDDELDRLAEFLGSAKRPALLCGKGCAGAHDEVVALAERLKAPIVHALGGKEYMEYDNPYDVGMTGLIGFSSGYHTLMDCDRLVMLGTDFPYRQFYPKDAKIAQIDMRGENLGRRCTLDIGIVGDMKPTLEALLPRLAVREDRSFLDKCMKHYREARADLDHLATGKAGDAVIHPQYVAKLISDLADDDAAFTCDVGTPTIWAARYLKMNGKRRLIGSFNHGSMANALPQAIGIQSAQPERQVISMSGDGGFAMLMGDFLTLAQMKLPVKTVIFNNGTLGFVEMEMKAAGFLETGVALQNPDFAAMANAVGIHGIRVEDAGDLEEALRHAFIHDGPALVDVVTNRQELSMPPEITYEQMKGFSLYALKAVMNGRGDELVHLATSNLFR